MILSLEAYYDACCVKEVFGGVVDCFYILWVCECGFPCFVVGLWDCCFYYGVKGFLE